MIDLTGVIIVLYSFLT